MSIQTIEILRDYLTCDDPVVRNKYYNLLDSFWHKSQGQLLVNIQQDEQFIILNFTNDIELKLPKPKELNLTIDDVFGLRKSLGLKVDKVPGKGLSENDFTNELLQKLNNLSNYTHPNSHPISMIDGLQDYLDNLLPKGGYNGTANNLYQDIVSLQQSLQNFKTPKLKSLTDDFEFDLDNYAINYYGYITPYQTETLTVKAKKPLGKSIIRLQKNRLFKAPSILGVAARKRDYGIDYTAIEGNAIFDVIVMAINETDVEYHFENRLNPN